MTHVIKGQLVSFPSSETIWHELRGAIAVGDDGRILWRGPLGLLPEIFARAPSQDFGNKLVLPGFIDAHIHFPQYRMLAAGAKDLLDWLSRYTFPEEALYADANHASKAAAIFLKRLFAHGTTSAMAFCSVHKTCAEALFTEAQKHKMALITGKTMMDRNAIPAVQDDPETGARESEELYNTWHGIGRLRYAVTPRFAVTSTEAQLNLSGELLKSLSGALMQTHISESAREIALVRELFPNAKDYTDVYEQFGLLSDRSVFAHGIHLSERECARLSETKSSVIHCPTSNTFLGSGLMSFDHLSKSNRPVSIGLGTDVGGGLRYSMLETMAEAYKVQMLNGLRLSPLALFHKSTLGNAALLHMAIETGSIEVGKYADLVVLDPEATEVMQARAPLSQSLEDQLFALMMLGDDRATVATYVAGQKVWG